MEAEAEPVFPLLALPPELADRIAYLLPPADRRSLASTCPTLRLAGRRWFRGAVVQASSQDGWLEDLTRWLEQCEGLVAYRPVGLASQINAGLATLPAGRVVAIHSQSEAPQWVEPWLSALTALTALSLNGQAQLSRGSDLEQILQPLAQLRQLDLADCELRTLPAALACCTQLTRLWLRRNQLAGGWQHLRPLAQLQCLWLWHTGCVPSSLQHLSQLTALDLDWSTNVLAGSHNLTALRLLRQLSMSFCDLAEVPAAVSTLTSLVKLLLVDNDIQGGFDHLRPLPQLQALLLFGNGLTEVPEAVSGLTTLTMLDLGPDVQGGWHHLRPLSQLTACDVVVSYINSEAQFQWARAALLNLHPAAVERMAEAPGGDWRQQVFAILRDGSFSDYQALVAASF